MSEENGEPLTCMVPGCGSQSLRRGLCPRCYQVVVKKVKLGKTTWDDLISAGLALPGKDRGTKGKWAIIQAALDAAKQKGNTDVPTTQGDV